MPSSANALSEWEDCARVMMRSRKLAQQRRHSSAPWSPPKQRKSVPKSSRRAKLRDRGRSESKSHKSWNTVLSIPRKGLLYFNVPCPPGRYRYKSPSTVAVKRKADRDSNKALWKVRSLSAQQYSRAKKSFASRKPTPSPLEISHKAINETEISVLHQARRNRGVQSSENLSDFLIDVWMQFDTFVLDPSSYQHPSLGSFHFTAENPMVKALDRFRDSDSTIHHSVVDKLTFLRQWRVFSESQFEGWTEWENMCVLGGSMVAAMLPVPGTVCQRQEIQHVMKASTLPFEASQLIAEYASEALRIYFHMEEYRQSDIDVYFFGLSNEEFVAKLLRLHAHLNRTARTVMVRTPYTITMVSEWPRRRIQIVLGKWDSIRELLCEPDIGCTAVAFTGDHLWATPRARQCYNTRCIIPSDRHYRLRGCPQYEQRLIKYSRRGFFISDLQLRWSDVSVASLEKPCLVGLSSVLKQFLFPGARAPRTCTFKSDGIPYEPGSLAETLKQIDGKQDWSYGSYGKVGFSVIGSGYAEVLSQCRLSYIDDQEKHHHTWYTGTKWFKSAHRRQDPRLRVGPAEASPGCLWGVWTTEPPVSIGELSDDGTSDLAVETNPEWWKRWLTRDHSVFGLAIESRREGSKCESETNPPESEESHEEKETNHPENDESHEEKEDHAGCGSFSPSRCIVPLTNRYHYLMT